MRVLLALLLVALPAPVPAGQAAPADSADYVGWYRMGMAARERGEDREFLRCLRRSSGLAPWHPTPTYRLAGAWARNGESRRAHALLRSVLRMDLPYDFDTNPDFAPLRRAPAYRTLLRERNRIRKPLVSSVLAFELPERDLLTEGIAFDPVSGDFFVSSVHRRKIVRVDAETGHAEDFQSEGAHGLWSVLGIAVDTASRSLWAVSAAMPQMAGFAAADSGLAALFRFDLDSGALGARLAAPAAPAGGQLNDLTIGARGEVYVSDALSGAVHRAVPGGDLAVFLPPGSFRNPQGLALSGDGGTLFVADYVQGIFAVDLATRERSRLAPPPNATLLGVDGLLALGRSLYVIQNGATPHRIARLELSPDGRRIVRARVLERSNPRLREPTLGVVARGFLYFVGTSQWGAFDEATGRPDEAALVPPAIFRIPLPGARQPARRRS